MTGIDWAEHALGAAPTRFTGEAGHPRSLRLAVWNPPASLRNCARQASAAASLTRGKIPEQLRQAERRPAVEDPFDDVRGRVCSAEDAGIAGDSSAPASAQIRHRGEAALFQQPAPPVHPPERLDQRRCRSSAPSLYQSCGAMMTFRPPRRHGAGRAWGYARPEFDGRIPDFRSLSSSAVPR